MDFRIQWSFRFICALWLSQVWHTVLQHTHLVYAFKLIILGYAFYFDLQYQSMLSSPS